MNIKLLLLPVFSLIVSSCASHTNHYKGIDKSLLLAQAVPSLNICVTPVSECLVTNVEIDARCVCPVESSSDSPNKKIVHFGTDRSYFPSEKPEKKFGTKRSKFRYGYSVVNIPPKHSKGIVERPFSEIFQNPNPLKHIVIEDTKVLLKDDFFKLINTLNDKSVIVFIHGYNVTHSQAIWRAAQLKNDLGHKGAMIAYTWPSNGSEIKYFIDEANIQWTEPKLKEFLVDIKTKLNPDKIHIIAHSMGNRAFTRVLYDLSLQGDHKLFNQIILAAPDIDADVFKYRIQPAIKLADNFTLYSSGDDLPLWFSSSLHEYPRAGQGKENALVMNDVDTIDASSIKGGLLEHSYFAKELLDDIKIILEDYVPPSSRNLIKKTKNKLKYWVVP